VTTPLDTWNGVRRLAVRRRGVIECDCDGRFLTTLAQVSAFWKGRLSTSVLLEGVHHLRIRLHRWMPEPALCQSQIDMVMQELRLPPPRPDRCDCCYQLVTRLVLDHDHGSDRVRGWVCESCNARIGLYEWRDNNREAAP
jgi:hypothetical protein